MRVQPRAGGALAYFIHRSASLRHAPQHSCRRVTNVYGQNTYMPFKGAGGSADPAAFALGLPDSGHTQSVGRDAAHHMGGLEDKSV